MNSVKYAALVISFVMLSAAGCKTLTTAPTPYEPWNPTEWERIEYGSDFVWTNTREQKIDTLKPLTLIDLVDVALRNNPSTRRAWEDARALEFQEKQAESIYYPQATVSVDITRQKKVASIKADEYNNLAYSPNLKITYLLLDFGGRSASVEGAFQEFLATNFQFNQTIQDLLLSVSTSYYELYSAQKTLENTLADLLDAKTSYNAATQKFNVGLVAKLDVLQAKSNYDNALYSFEVAKGDVKTAKAGVANAIGFPADTKFDIVSPVKEVSRDIIKDINKRNVSHLIEESLKKRPSIAAVRASLKAKEAEIKVANSSLWPTLNLEGTAQKDWYELYGNPKSHEDDYAYAGFLSVNWNIFDGFYNLNRKRAAQAQAYAERERLKQLELEASSDVWIKYYGFRTAVQKLIASKSYYNSSRASYDLALEGYDAGLKSMLDLLKAQSDLSNARSKLIQSKKDLFVALAELAHATGSLDVNKIREHLER